MGSAPAAFHLSKREIGGVHPTLFARSLCGTKDLVNGLRRSHGLQHPMNRTERLFFKTGCFSYTGELLVATEMFGSRLFFWDWADATLKSTIDSGHSNGILESKFLQDGALITTGYDKKVRHHSIQGGQVASMILARHQTEITELAIAPGITNTFYGCGFDGLFRYDARTAGSGRILNSGTASPRISHIAANPRDSCQLAVAATRGGPSDYTKKAWVYDIRRSGRFEDALYSVIPKAVMGLRGRDVKIDALQFSEQGELLLSYDEWNIYLHSGTTPYQICGIQSHLNQFSKRVSFFGPNSEYVLIGYGRNTQVWKKDAVEQLVTEVNIGQKVMSDPRNMILASITDGLEHHFVSAADAADSVISIWSV